MITKGPVRHQDPYLLIIDLEIITTIISTNMSKWRRIGGSLQRKAIIFRALKLVSRARSFALQDGLTAPFAQHRRSLSQQHTHF